MFIIAFLSIQLLISSPVDSVFYDANDSMNMSARCLYEDKFEHQNFSIININSLPEFFSLWDLPLLIYVIQTKAMCSQASTDYVPGTWERLTYKKKKYEKHTTMKRKYKLPNLQPGVLTYSFNPSRWNTNEAKNLQRQPSLYSEFHASRVTLWKLQLAKVERGRDYRMSSFKWNIYALPLT